MRKIILSVFLSVLLNNYTYASEPAKTSLQFQHATVKIIKTFIRPDYSVPWKMKGYSSAVGSGVIIKNNMILTNAHVISDATFIEVQKENDPDRYEAQVLFAGHECDLALLLVKDSKFFEGTVYLELGGMPELKSMVATYGYPMGGERISITEGVVSRIEIGVYSHSRKSSLLMIQTDAAINPGNSGGPVIQNGKIVGIAFQAMAEASNIGYMIPVPVISHFLKDISDLRYDGVPDIGVFTDDLMNESYRQYIGMGKGQTGIIVTGIIKGAGAEKFLKAGDVIMRIDGIHIANDGSIPFEDGRIRYSVIIDNKQIGEKVRLEVLRDRRAMTVTFPVDAFPARIPWYNEYEKLPEYFIFGGIVFQPLNREFLECWDEWWYKADRRMLYYFSYVERDEIQPERSEFILINQVLPDAINTYISGLSDVIVDKINGQKINSLEDVISAVKKPAGAYHIIEVEGNGKPIILKAAGIDDANERILLKYNIPSDRRLKKDTGY